PQEKEQQFTLKANLELLARLTNLPSEEKKALLVEYCMSASTEERFVFNKLITGNSRMGVSRQLMVKALAKYLNHEATSIAHQLMGKWNPNEETMASMFAGETHLDKYYLPYPFFLAYQLDDDPESLGDIHDWFIEKKLDGIRGQI